MSERREFNFGNKGVPAAYDDVLVPVLFEPWAEALVARVAPREGWSVVDVATGTGIVAQKLADCVGPGGSVIAADLSPEMLALARVRCAGHGSVVRFVETPAAPLQLESDSADAVYCQQGFQFFPDKRAAAAEMYRVVRPGGMVAVSTWCPLAQCAFFGAINEQLKQCGEDEVADMIGVPFDHMSAAELSEAFRAAGFENIVMETPEADIDFRGGVEQAYETVFATPIGPRLRAFPEQKQVAFRDGMRTALSAMTENGVTSCRLVSNLLVAEKHC